MGKIKLTQRRWAKVLAFTLILALVPATILSLCGFVYGLDEGWYGSQSASFYESSLCLKLARREALEAVKYELWQSTAGDNIDWEYDEGAILDESNSNLLYVISDADGNVIGQNCDGETCIPVFDEFFGSFGYYRYGEYRYGEYLGSGDIEISAKVYLREPMTVEDEFYTAKRVFDLFYENRGALPFILGASVILGLALFVFLLRAAGHVPGEDGVVLRGHNRLPLDLYAVVLGLVFCGGFVAFISCGDFDLPLWLTVGLLLAGTWLCAGSALLLCVTLSARIKAGGWWKNSLIWRLGVRLWGVLRRLWRLIAETAANLPTLWKLILGFALYLLVNAVLSAMLFGSGEAAAVLLLIIFNGGVLLALCRAVLHAQRLLKGGQALAEGDLSYKVDLSGMYWELLRHGHNLNSISEGMSRAVDERMRSERFKTELITNVSHDIKTPLTSIISYVDLLKKEEPQSEKARGYIEVLDRQSARLKKLTEDLVEASKASSGAVKLNLERVDVSELLHQTVGEYAERLEQAGITPVVSVPETPLPVRADGRQLWRIFENLLSNIRKYSLPGTRAYITAEGVNGGAFITLRNISAEALNISADELMERFVRGDSSRSTEGSGLGLSIARSLAELMGGALELFLDGDLFKVVVSFPLVYEGPETGDGQSPS